MLGVGDAFPVDAEADMVGGVGVEARRLDVDALDVGPHCVYVCL